MRYAIVVIVDADDSEQAWKKVALRMGVGKQYPQVERHKGDYDDVHYVGAPWKGIPDEFTEPITDGIELGSAESDSGPVDLVPCD